MLVYPSSSSAWSASMEYFLPSEHPMSSLVSVSGNLFFTCAGHTPVSAAQPPSVLITGTLQRMRKAECLLRPLSCLQS